MIPRPHSIDHWWPLAGIGALTPFRRAFKPTLLEDALSPLLKGLAEEIAIALGSPTFATNLVGGLNAYVKWGLSGYQP
jgi:hypothetical protein